jgi:prepilin-type N-terminal cleavage/methylation domain-containing protein
MTSKSTHEKYTPEQRNTRRLMNHLKAFTLVELMAVVLIILIMLGGTSVLFLNGRESVKIRADANHLISFMRSMLDYTKATGVPLVIQFNPKDHSFSYLDPRNEEIHTVELESKARILAVKLNERLYTPETLSGEVQSEEVDDPETTVYVSEGKGLITLSMLLAVKDEDEQVTNAMLTQLNLISGKGQIIKLNPEEVQRFFEEAEEAADQLGEETP